MAKGPLERERKLQFEKKNKDLVQVPKYARIEKRPIPHAPVASPYAGSSVPKVVYVSSKSPFMSAVKRVQKLLRCAEKRATASASTSVGRGGSSGRGAGGGSLAIDSKKVGSTSEKERIARIVQGTHEKLQTEQVLVKATGRAIEKALSVGKWFEEKHAEYNVVVKTGSVLVVDDIVEDEEAKREFIEKNEKMKTEDEEETNEQEGDAEKTTTSVPTEAGSTTTTKATATVTDTESTAGKKKKRKRQAPDSAADDAEVPETRTRWIKMVEIAVTLK